MDNVIRRSMKMRTEYVIMSFILFIIVLTVILGMLTGIVPGIQVVLDALKNLFGGK